MPDDADQSRDAVAQPPTIEIRATVNPAVPTVRSYFSTQHLWAANHFAHLAAECERTHARRAPKVSIQHRVYVITAVSESVAFLEATVNEILQDAHDDHHGYVGPLGDAKIAALSAYWGSLNRGQSYVLKKYTRTLTLCGGTPIAVSDPRYQDAAALVDLRNALTHYRPASVSVIDPHPLDAVLKGRFAPNALLDSGNAATFYPEYALGAGCAEWSVVTATAIADHFATELGLTLNYQQVHWLREPPRGYSPPEPFGGLAGGTAGGGPG